MSCDGFPKSGVKIVYVIGEFIDIIGGIDAIQGLTTAQVCERHIKPLTFGTKSSYCDLLKQQGHTSYVEKADIFVSHAHAYLFEDFVSALKWRLREEPNASVWLDLFSINQHEPMDWTFDWLATTFKSNVARIGRTVMVMSPWDNPLPYSRSWCVFEVYSCAEANGRFEIAMSENDEVSFLKDIQEDPEGRINQILTTIRAEKSECSVETDKKAIFEVIQKTIGFAKLDSIVFERYREWVIEVSVKALIALNDDSERLGLLGVVGVLYLGQGKYEEAESYGKQFLETSKRLMGPDHPNSLTAMNNLALTFDSQGQYTKAEELYRACLQHRKATLGEDHADTLMTSNNLAVTLSNQGKYSEAEKLYKDCLQRQRTTFGDDHPETLRAMNNVADVYGKQELYPLAEDLYRRCLERRKVILGNEHPDSLKTMNNLAGALASQRKYKDAENLYRVCLEREIAILGDDHPETIRTKKHLDKTLDRRSYDLSSSSFNSRRSSASSRNSAHSLRSDSFRSQQSRLSFRQDSFHSHLSSTSRRNSFHSHRSQSIRSQQSRHSSNRDSIHSHPSSLSRQSSLHSGPIPSRPFRSRQSYQDNAAAADAVVGLPLQLESGQIRSLPREIELVDDPPNIGQDDGDEIMGDNSSSHDDRPLPKCVCNWKNCRTYQKSFREYQHALFDGVVKLKFYKSDGKSLALKTVVDRTLQVNSVKKNDWKTAEGQQFCRYYVARHHFTENLLEEYLADPRSWDWNESLTVERAAALLWNINDQDKYATNNGKKQYDSDGNGDDITNSRYMLSPNVPREIVKGMVKKIKKSTKKDMDGLGSRQSPNKYENSLLKEEEKLRLKKILRESQDQISQLQGKVMQLRSEIDRTELGAKEEDSDKEGSSQQASSISQANDRSIPVRKKLSRRGLRRDSVRSWSTPSTSRNSLSRNSRGVARYDSFQSTRSSISSRSRSTFNRNSFLDSYRKSDDEVSVTSRTSQSSRRSVSFAPDTKNDFPQEIDLSSGEDDNGIINRNDNHPFFADDDASKTLSVPSRTND